MQRRRRFLGGKLNWKPQFEAHPKKFKLAKLTAAEFSAEYAGRTIKFRIWQDADGSYGAECDHEQKTMGAGSFYTPVVGKKFTPEAALSAVITGLLVGGVDGTWRKRKW